MTRKLRDARFGALGIWCVAACVALIASACSGGDDDDDDDDGGELVWSLDFESADDLAAKGATLVAGDADAAFVPGLTGNAIALGEGVQLVAPAIGRVPSTDGTLEMWVLPKTVWHDGIKRHLLAIGDETNFSMFKDGLKNKPVFAIGGAGVTPTDDRPVLDYYGFSIRKPWIWRSGWTHFAVTWKGVGDRDHDAVRRLYLDGSLVAEMRGPVSGFDADVPILLGGLQTGSAPDALVDDLRVWNRAMSEAEIYDRGFRADVQSPYKLAIVPEPHPAGFRPEAGFTPNAETVIALPPDQMSRYADVASFLQDAIERMTGSRPALAPSVDVTGADNVIAIGTLDDNGVLRAMNDARFLPAGTVPGSYLLEVSASGIAVAGADFAGAIYGTGSLLRVVNQHESAEAIPAITVADRPDFPIRGTVVENLLPLTDEAKRRIRYLGELKLTHLVIPGDWYFDLDNEFVREDGSELFEFVRAHGMEPVPAFSWYGHADRVIAECALRGYDCAEGDSDDTCPLVEGMYTDILEPMLANIRDVLAPTAIHIGHTDIARFNENPVCASAAKSPAELFGYSVSEVVRRVRSQMPGTHVFVWADMIASMQNGSRLAAPAPGENPPEPPSVYGLIPKDDGITWCAWLANGSAILNYVYAFSTFTEFSAAGIASYVGGPGGDNVSQSFMWMKNASDFGGSGFIGKPTPGTSDDFADPNWLWLPATEELAWSLWTPDGVGDLFYDFGELNAAYGSY